MRIQRHPIIEDFGKTQPIHFTLDGRQLTGYQGDTIAAALRAEGIMIHRYTSKQHRPRGVFCAIGRCTDCVMIVNGRPNVRTCITPLEPGMVVQTQYGVTAGEEVESGEAV